MLSKFKDLYVLNLPKLGLGVPRLGPWVHISGPGVPRLGPGVNISVPVVPK